MPTRQDRPDAADATGPVLDQPAAQDQQAGPDHLAVLPDLQARFADALRTADLAAPVPACAGWTVTELALHLGAVHRWAAGMGPAARPTTTSSRPSPGSASRCSPSTGSRPPPWSTPCTGSAPTIPPSPWPPPFWHLDQDPAPGRPAATVSGPARMLALLLWRRSTLDDDRLTVTGDRDAATAALARPQTPDRPPSTHPLDARDRRSSDLRRCHRPAGPGPDYDPRRRTAKIVSRVSAQVGGH